METKEMIEMINVVSSKGEHAIQKYSEWYFVSAITWFSVGIILLLASFIVYRKVSINKEFKTALSVLFFIGGILFIGANTASMFAPDGMATHKFIKDIRGGK